VLYHHDNEVSPGSENKVILSECFYNTNSDKIRFPDSHFISWISYKIIFSLLLGFQ